MGATERRLGLLNVLSKRRYDTVTNLANEFGVSERTIRRDIDILSGFEPIYTQCGRYTGGVYMLDGCRTDRKFLDPEETSLLEMLICFAETDKQIVLNEANILCLKRILSTFSMHNQ